MPKSFFNAKTQTCVEQSRSRRKGFIRWWVSLLVGVLVGCQVSEPLPTPIMPAIATVLPTETAVSVQTVTPQIIPATDLPPVEPTATIDPDTGWQEVRTGLERRHIFVLDAENQPRDRLTILRLEPALYNVRVAYRPGKAQSLEAWQAETGALITVNGGFFTEDYHATGLTIIDGEVFGASYGDFAGMLAVTESGAEVRWLRERPYDPNEPLQYALQSFPMLVKPGGVLGFPDEDGLPARRTVIGEDEDGRLLFIIAPGGFMTLHQLSQWLAQSDLDLHTALNLDGGTSTGLLLTDSPVSIPAYTLLPAVILLYER